MKRKKMLIVLATLAVVVIAGAVIGLSMYFRPVKDFANSDAEASLKAGELFSQFEKNQVSANARFVTNDMTIEVSGKIDDIEKNDDGTLTINLGVPDPEGDISCTLTKEESIKAGSRLKPGMNITLKGQCTGYQELINKEVIMMRCGVVE